MGNAISGISPGPVALQAMAEKRYSNTTKQHSLNLYVLTKLYLCNI